MPAHIRGNICRTLQGSASKLIWFRDCEISIVRLDNVVSVAIVVRERGVSNFQPA